MALAVTLAGLFVAESIAGEIRGTVLNQNTQSYLTRATIQVQGTQFQALTDTDGSFRISGLPSGNYTLIANYAGLDEQTKAVTLIEGQAATVDFSLASNIYKLGEFVVSSTVEGSAFAVNQQRRAESLRSVTSIDSFGDNVSGNPGEFLRNVSGIQMDFSQVEPNYIRVRGFDSTLTLVTMDGNAIASADSASTERRTAIDQLSLGTLENVEVFKAPLPSMSANSIGGSVNFNTKSAFNQKGRRASLTFGITANSQQFDFDKTPGGGHTDTPNRKVIPVGRLDYSNSFLNGRLGVVMSTGYTNTWVPADSESNGLVIAALPGQTLPAIPTLYTQNNVSLRRGSFSIAPNQQNIRRADISVNTDFKLVDQVELFLKTTYTDYWSTNRNHAWTLNPGTTGIVPGFTLTDYTTTAGTVSQGVNIHTKFSKSWQLSPGLRFKSDNWRVDLVSGFSKATNHYRNDNDFNSLNITLANVGYSMHTPANTDIPTSIVQNSGPDFYNLNNYIASQADVNLSNSGGFVANNVRDSSEAIYSGRLDARRDFHTRFPFYLKAGLDYKLQLRDKRQPQRRWNWVGPDGIIGTADDTMGMGMFAEPVPVPAGFGVRSPTFFSAKLAQDYMRIHPEAFRENLAYAAEQSITGKRQVDETVKAAYIMGNVTIHRLDVLTGLRVEETDEEATGSSLNNSLIPAGVNANSLAGVLAKYRVVKTKSSYRTPPFKYLHLKYELLNGLQARASYTEAIGRPSYSQILPTMTINDTAKTVNVNNVGILPQNSKSIDFSLEYYPKSAGEWTISWWNKEVKDYISNTSSLITEADPELNIGSELIGYTLTTTQNLGSAKYNGYEIGVVQKLRDFQALPRFLHGIELFANFTHNYKQTGDFGNAAIAAGTAPKITQLAGVAPKLYNAGIRFRTPGGKFAGALITNYQSEISSANLPVTTTGGQSMQITEPYVFWNMDVSYRWSPRILFKATARNLTAERKVSSQIGGIVTGMQNDSGTFWLFSTKIDL